VKQYQNLAAQDIRFDAPLADACYDDRAKLCANVAPVSALLATGDRRRWPQVAASAMLPLPTAGHPHLCSTMLLSCPSFHLDSRRATNP